MPRVDDGLTNNNKPDTAAARGEAVGCCGEAPAPGRVINSSRDRSTMSSVRHRRTAIVGIAFATR
jgi:hypothetical protein